MLVLPLLLPTAAVFGATIDFEQFSPVPITCGIGLTANDQAPHVGVALFTGGQLATALPGALDQTTVYWDSLLPCGGTNRTEIEFFVAVSDVQFYLENLEDDRPAVTYEIHSSTLSGSHTDFVTLEAPCGSPRCHSSAIVTLPYNGIRGVIIHATGPTPIFNFLIDNITFAFPIELLDVWNRVCLLSVNPACGAIQKLLLDFGFFTPTPSATPTQTPTPSACGAIGEPCCPPAVPPCNAGSCDPLTGTCVAPTPTETPTPSACGGSGEPCCPVPGAVGVYTCDVGTCDPASLKCP